MKKVYQYLRFKDLTPDDPKTITLETKDGFKQKIKLDNVRGMQYPNIQAMETSELKIYLDDIYDGENDDFAISEIRLLGMELN